LEKIKKEKFLHLLTYWVCLAKLLRPVDSKLKETTLIKFFL
jgi:hypothetical protein